MSPAREDWPQAEYPTLTAWAKAAPTWTRPEHEYERIAAEEGAKALTEIAALRAELAVARQDADRLAAELDKVGMVFPAGYGYGQHANVRAALAAHAALVAGRTEPTPSEKPPHSPNCPNRSKQ